MRKIVFIVNNFTFSIQYFFEKWLDDLDIIRESLCKLPNYIINHQIRSDHKGGGVSIHNHKMFDFKTRPDFSVNHKEIEAITVEIVKSA